MSDSEPTCSKCRASMNRGHVPDYAHGDVIARETVWSSGDPKPRRFQTGIKVDSDAEIPLMAYRCVACGYVEFYARPHG